MFVVDAAIRFPAIALLLVILVTSLRDLAPSRSGRYLQVACICVMGALLDYTPPYIAWGSPVTIVAGLLAAFDLPALWLFALSLFDSAFRVRWPHLIMLALYSGPKVVTVLQNTGLVDLSTMLTFTFVNIVSLVLMGHIVFRLLADRQEDLVPERRRSRIIFVCVLVAFGAGSAVISLVASGPWFATSKAALLLAAIAFSAQYLLAIDAQALSFVRSSDPEPASAPIANPALERLERAMGQDAAYRDPDLTITKLASIVDLPVYKLRQLILEELEHDNFKTYLNARRIASVKRMLRDPSCADRPIVEIAIGQGFNSLSTFNRAFRNEVGMTPSQYRKGED